ncbi:capsular biosynthesis protein [Listeria booriae]|uniref:YveK family protein n=1 Tax=Listeria booriae TaxID=1552123 RepID=UPI0016247658|nr:Wzz/FepE/Etk N-terminal domain-containing protein [Listeria booriae]MBC2370200.1 capsular biosynthesis protein [Listeria booriae]
MESNIDLKGIYLMFVKKKWYMIIAIVVSVMVMSIYLGFITTPTYYSKAQVLVNQTVDSQNVQTKDVQADLQLIDTYSAIVTSPRIITEIKRELNNKYSEAELMEAIQVSNNSNSQILEISSEYSDPRATVEIANKTAEVFIKEIPDIMKVDNVTILSNAQYVHGQEPIKPHKSLMIILSVFIGFLIGSLIIFIKMLFDRTIKNVDDLQKKYGLNLLGTVNEFSPEDLVGKEGQKNEEVKS